MGIQQDALASAIDRWNAGDLDGYLRLYDDAIVLHGFAPEPMDKHAVRGFYEMVFAAFGTPKLEINEVIEDGDVVACRFTMTGRHVGEFMGVAPTGVAIALPGITTLRFVDDRVTERHSQADMLGLLVQIGAVPAPA